MKSIRIILLLAFAFDISDCLAQQPKNVLFIGNSYTAVNNLPNMVTQIAESMGDQMIWQSNTPGGCNFQQHCTNQSMNLICHGGWDVVVLQEQSQLPSFPYSQVVNQVFPYAQRLVDSVYAYSPCCEPMFYMTWGRKNGDGQNAVEFPVLGTYEGMDSMLCERYTYMAHQYDASLSPVGRVWHWLRDNTDIELYSSDGSHPSLAGTYAAACSFYVLIFHRDPDSITFCSSLQSSEAQSIRSAVRTVVFENLEQWQRPKPKAIFSAVIDENHTVEVSSSSTNAGELLWNFGDGTTVDDQEIVRHSYIDTGFFTISLVASRHCMTDTAIFSFHIAPDSIGIDTTDVDTTVVAIVGTITPTVAVFPIPASEYVTIDFPQTVGPITATLLDMQGRVLVNRCLQSSTSISIPLADLPKGMYILKVHSPTFHNTRKILHR